jgi:hypothetical protein
VTGPSVRPRWTPRLRLGKYAPLPLFSAAILLVVLILFTPVLLPTGGQPAPGILTQAELIVDRVPGNQTTHLYVHGLGTTARYSNIWVGLAGGFNWSGSGSPNWTALSWTRWSNETDVLSLSVASESDPVAITVTAYYVSPGGTAWYAGVVAFFVGAGPGPTGEALYTATNTSGLGLPSAPTPVDNASLPLTILLPFTSSGSPP